MSTRHHLHDRYLVIKDNIINRKRYRSLKKSIKRNWFDDYYSLDAKSIRVDVDPVNEVNRIVINDKIVGEFTYGETALLYRFLKKCIYG